MNLERKQINANDIDRVLLGINNDIHIAYAVSLDTLYSSKGDRNSLFLAQFIEKHGDQIKLEKLEGILAGIREWQQCHSLSGQAIDIILKFIRKRILGGDSDDANWINIALAIISQSFSFQRLKILLSLLSSRKKIPLECQESYLNAIEMGLSFAKQNPKGYALLYNEFIKFSESGEDNNINLIKDVSKLIDKSKNDTLKKVILFVHGLGGDALKTWRKFPELILGDNDLNADYDVEMFEYPTSLFSVPYFGKKSCGIKELSNSLRTRIYTKLRKYEEIIIICHSLGGLIAKEHLLRERKANRECKTNRILYYATPHDGAALAAVAKKISFQNNQLRQLCKTSDFLSNLNEEWDRHKMNETLNQLYVVGGQDRVVSLQSTQGVVSDENLRTIADKGHRDLVKVDNRDEDSYLIFKQFIIE